MLPALEFRNKTEKNHPETDAAQVVRHLAHELRQPLSTLESLAYYLNIVLPQTDAKSRQQIEKIQQMIHQANGIIDDAVHFTQAAPPHPSAVALDQLMGQVLADGVRTRGLNLHLKFGTEPCVAWVDPAHIEHIFAAVLNLFRQISQPGTAVNVTTGTRLGQAEVRFCCTSASVDANQLHHMFEPFNRKTPVGTGLSLASVQSIVEAHDGHLEIKAEPDQRLAVSIRFSAAR